MLNNKKSYKPFPIIGNIVDYDSQYSNEYKDNTFISEYAYYDSSILSFMNKVKQIVNRLRFSTYEDIEHNELKILSFNPPLLSFFHIKITTDNNTLCNNYEYKPINISDEKCSDNYDKYDKYVIIFEFIEGNKNYLFNLYRWININLLQIYYDKINITYQYHPQIINNISIIEDIYIIILLDRLMSNNDLFIEDAIVNICKLMYNAINHELFIKNNVLEYLFEYILKKYDKFNEKNWQNIINSALVIYYVVVRIKKDSAKYNEDLKIKNEHLAFLQKVMHTDYSCGTLQLKFLIYICAMIYQKISEDLC